MIHKIHRWTWCITTASYFFIYFHDFQNRKGQAAAELNTTHNVNVNNWVKSLCLCWFLHNNRKAGHNIYRETVSHTSNQNYIQNCSTCVKPMYTQEDHANTRLKNWGLNPWTVVQTSSNLCNYFVWTETTIHFLIGWANNPSGVTVPKLNKLLLIFNNSRIRNHSRHKNTYHKKLATAAVYTR